VLSRQWGASGFIFSTLVADSSLLEVRLETLTMLRGMGATCNVCMQRCMDKSRQKLSVNPPITKDSQKTLLLCVTDSSLFCAISPYRGSAQESLLSKLEVV
jgi:hypothetical protein